MFRAVALLFFTWSTSATLSSLFRSAELLSGNDDWIVEPVKVIPIDDGQWDRRDQHVSYMVHRQGENSTSFVLDLKLNSYFNARVPIESDRPHISIHTSKRLFYTGSVRHWGESNSIVAMSVSPGLTGLIHHTQDGMDYFLEPIVDDVDEQSHILTYQRKVRTNANHLWSCELNSSTTTSHTFVRHDRKRRSVIRERFIETLLVADPSVTEFFAHPQITELYLLTMMNMVHSIYAHVSLGYPVEIVLTRIIMLTNQSDFQMASKSHETLNSFCEWQERLKKSSGKNRTNNHDVAVFLTRKSLCHYNSSCSTIGLAHMAGMCVTNRSCNINQDLGFISAFTIAHEIGHNLGMSHDGDKGHCKSNAGSSQSDTIMVPSYSTVPVKMWSKCSRDNLTDYFDQGAAPCLNNKPALIKPFDDLLPGIIFDLDEQCRLALGPLSSYCFLGDEPPVDVCHQLMCVKMHEGRPVCISSMTSQPADGTVCGDNKWCLHGRCTPMSYRAETPPINGGWSPWTPWSSCSHTCGLGVEYQERTCTNPKPDFGGKHCLGTRKRYRTCTLAPCKKRPLDSVKHESHLNCEELNSKSNGTKWKTVPWFTSLSCMVFCTPILSSLSVENNTSSNSNITLAGDEVGKVESIKFRDGTQCTIDSDDDEFAESHGMCIAGQCQKLGCDQQLYSTAVEDECGICHGNRSHCQERRKIVSYKKPETIRAGSYVKIGSIAKGISTFHVEKSFQPNSFLAVRIKDRYYINGNHSIISEKTFQMGHTRIWYERGSKREVLDGRGSPLNEAIDIMLLILTKDVVNVTFIHWELVNYTIAHQTKSLHDYYIWTFENDTYDECSCTTRQPQCIFKSQQNELIVVSDQLCDPKSKPRPLKCRNSNCPIPTPTAPRWQVGAWRVCEGRCWPQEAIQRRSLLCVRTASSNRTHVIPTSICIGWLPTIPVTIRECPQNISSGLPKCSALKAYHRWAVGEWTGNCSSPNPCATQYRTVTCASHDANSICTADDRSKPVDRRPCNTACGHWRVSHWSMNCTGPCHNASVTRRVSCSSSLCNEHQQPLSARRCVPSHCANGSIHQTSSTTSTRPTAVSTKAPLKTVKPATTSPKKSSAVTKGVPKSSLTTKTTTATSKQTSGAKSSSAQQTTSTTKPSTKKQEPTSKVTAKSTMTTKKKVTTTNAKTTTAKAARPSG